VASIFIFIPLSFTSPCRRGFTLIPHPSSLIPHPSSLIPHPSSLIPHPSSLIPHPSSLTPHLSPAFAEAAPRRQASRERGKSKGVNIFQKI